MGPLSSWTVSSVTLTIWTSCAGEPPEANARAWTGFTRSSLGGELTDEGPQLRIVRCPAGLDAQRRSREAVAAARDEIDRLLAADGRENVRALQRSIRNTMTEHAGVVRDEAGLRAGLAELDEIEKRMDEVGIHPDIAGYQDLAHAFDLTASALAARATLEAALERRETRGCHNRSDYPELDPSLRVNLVWSPSTGVVREEIAPVPAEIADLIREVSVAGKLVE